MGASALGPKGLACHMLANAWQPTVDTILEEMWLSLVLHWGKDLEETQVCLDFLSSVKATHCPIFSGVTS